MKGFKTYLLFFVIFSAFAFLLAGCGGGGGEGGVGGGPATQSITVSGSAIASPGPSGLVGGASLRKQQTGNPADGAQIIIKSYDNNGNLKETVETVSTVGGGFSSNINILSTGGYITVSATKDSFTRFEKTFTYKTSDDLKGGLKVLAELDPVLTKVVNVDNPWDWTASAGNDTLSIGVVESSAGRREILSDSEIKIAKASGSKVIWQIDLPRNVLKKQGIGSLAVKINNYNPANSSDAKRFPSDTDNSGNKLVSAGFDYLDIKTNTGQPLKLSSSSLGAAAALSYRIKRRIPDCNLIKCGDEDPNKEGVQIGFYFIQNGKWKKLGNTTLYADPDNDDTPFTGSCTPDSEPYAVLTEADVANLDLSGISWCNIDYVLGNAVAACGDQLKAGCITGTVNSVKTDGTTEILKGMYLYLSGLKNTSVANFNFMGTNSYDYTKDNGSYRIDFTYTGTGTISNPTATVSYSDPFTWNWATKDYELSDSNMANSCYVLDIDIPDPYGCEVKGKILKADGITGAADKWVYVYQPGTYYGYKGANSGSNGSYSISVVCNTDYVLYAEGETKNFSVNGSIGADEKSDTGTVVEMKDITFANHAPQAYAYAYQTSVNTGDVVQLYGYGYDPDGDPLTYSWTATCGTFDNASAQYPKWTAPNDNAACTLTLTVSDGQGGTGTASLDILVSKTNRAPVITSIYVPSNAKAGTTHKLYSYAYDPDGDDLTYSWEKTCGTFDNASAQNPKWTAPSEAGDCTLQLTISDGNGGSDSASKTTKVYANRAPVINSINAPSQVSKGKAITLYSNAYDPDGDVITYNWSLTCGTLANSTSQNPTWTAPNTVTTCNITLEAKDPDNLTASKTVTISSVNAPPVITAFNVPDTAKLGDTVTLSAAATDADGDTLTYAWYIQGAQVGTGPSYTWSPVEQGTYSVEVKVSDGVSAASQNKNVVISGQTSVDIIIQNLFKSKKGGK